MTDVKHLTMAELHAGLEDVRQAPRNAGRLELIVRRPGIGERECLETAELDLIEGLVGDGWQDRGAPTTTDGSSDPNCQITIMNARAVALVACDRQRWPLAGDQLYVDLDLSGENLPPGTRLAIGMAVLEVSAQPHTGCKKFIARFGQEAMKFVNSPLGRQLNLRGINTKVVQAGTIRVGDFARKLT
jgi:hypothetical protein